MVSSIDLTDPRQEVVKKLQDSYINIGGPDPTPNPNFSTQPVDGGLKPIADASQKDALKKVGDQIKGRKFLTPPAEKKFKGKYIGKDKYKGLAKNAKKKYKGKYIGPDRFKGDAAAYNEYKAKKKANRNAKAVKKVGNVTKKYKLTKPGKSTPVTSPGVLSPSPVTLH
jgi:hypothetical protein